MTKKTRYFMGGSAAILVAGLGTGSRRLLRRRLPVVISLPLGTVGTELRPGRCRGRRLRQRPRGDGLAAPPAPQIVLPQEQGQKDEDKKLQVVRIHSDEIQLVVPGGHTLADRDSVEASDLLNTPLLLPKSGTTRSRLNAWLEPIEDELQTSMELDSTEMIKQFVVAGLGVSFLAASHCRDEVASGKLVACCSHPSP